MSSRPAHFSPWCRSTSRELKIHDHRQDRLPGQTPASAPENHHHPRRPLRPRLHPRRRPGPSPPALQHPRAVLRHPPPLHTQVLRHRALRDLRSTRRTLGPNARQHPQPRHAKSATPSPPTSWTPSGNWTLDTSATASTAPASTSARPSPSSPPATGRSPPRTNRLRPPSPQ